MSRLNNIYKDVGQWNITLGGGDYRLVYNSPPKEIKILAGGKEWPVTKYFIQRNTCVETVRNELLVRGITNFSNEDIECFVEEIFSDPNIISEKSITINPTPVDVFNIGDTLRVQGPNKYDETGKLVHIIKAGESPSDDIVFRFFMNSEFNEKKIKQINSNKRPALVDRFVLELNGDFHIMPMTPNQVFITVIKRIKVINARNVMRELEVNMPPSILSANINLSYLRDCEMFKYLFR